MPSRRLGPFSKEVRGVNMVRAGRNISGRRGVPRRYDKRLLTKLWRSSVANADSAATASLDEGPHHKSHIGGRRAEWLFKSIKMAALPCERSSSGLSTSPTSTTTSKSAQRLKVRHDLRDKNPSTSTTFSVTQSQY